MSKLSKTLKRKQKEKLKHFAPLKPVVVAAVDAKALIEPVITQTSPAIDYQALCERADNSLQVDMTTLKRMECIEIVKLLEQVANYHQQENPTVDALVYRQRAIELLEYLFSSKAPSVYLSKLYSKQLRQLALINGKRANTLKTQDSINALHHANLAVQAIEKLYAQEEEQPLWLNTLYGQQLRFVALTHNQLAQQHKQQQDDKLAVQDWALANQAIEKLLARFPERLADVTELYNKQLRQSALAYDRLADNAKDQWNEELTKQYWALGLQVIQTLRTHFPEQPNWVEKLAAKQAKTYLLGKNP